MKAVVIINKDNINIKAHIMIIGVNIPNNDQNVILNPINDVTELKLAI